MQMSPIENVVPNLVLQPNQAQELELKKKQDRSRDLFGVQLEVSQPFIFINNQGVVVVVVKENCKQ